MSDLVEELKDAALTVNASSIESGCAECGMNSSLMENAADEIYRLRAKLERARDALASAHWDCTTMRGKNYICKRCLALRELENGGGDE